MENIFENVLATVKNVQIYPAKKRVELNDKATEIIFNLTRETYRQIIEMNAQVTITEKKTKKGKIQSSFSIQNENGYSNFIPLNAFDRAVLSVCVSNWLEGNRYITPAIIYRGLTGKVNDKSGDAKPNGVQLAAIFQSIDKLMFTTYDKEVIDAYKKLHYIKDDEEVEIVKSALMPCYRVKTTINGQVAHSIFFDRESPLLSSAKLKKQLLTYDAELLDVPKQNNTPMVIAVKNYVMHRVQEIKLHKMRAVLTFDDIFRKCRIETTKNKQRGREYVEIFFKHLQDKGQIKTFKFNKKRNSFYSVEFTY